MKYLVLAVIAIKNIEFNNQTRLKRLYEDEKTKLLRLKEEKRIKEQCHGMETGSGMLLEWLRNRFTLANCIGNLSVQVLKHGVPGGVLGNRQAFQDWNTTGHQGSQRSRGSGQAVLFYKLPYDGSFQHE